MRIPLNYQRTEYDCGPTSVLNAINYLFEREYVPPEIIPKVLTATLDAYNSLGEYGRKGTSQTAMNYLSIWLNQFSFSKGLPLSTIHITGKAVNMLPDGLVVSTLLGGGAAVMRLMHSGHHYVLITGLSKESVELFDPYYITESSPESSYSVSDQECCNRRVPLKVMLTEGSSPYNMIPTESRDAILFFNRRPDL